MDTNGHLAGDVVSQEFKRRVFCPFCFSAGTVRGHPIPGDLGVCKGCKRVSVFTWTHELRRPRPHELSGIAANPFVKALK